MYSYDYKYNEFIIVLYYIRVLLMFSEVEYRKKLMIIILLENIYV